MPNNNALYIVATPIGNLGDITFRAIEVLKQVDYIAAEDTRHSAKLAHYFDIGTPLIPYHDHSSEQQTRRILDMLSAGKSVALISDAGTPLISDPGYRLVSTARQRGFTVVPIPGACALVAAVSASGLPSDRFSFEGFPPAKAGARAALFQRLKQDARTLVFYESPHRIQDSLSAMAEEFGAEREVVLARELTKNYETFLSGSFGDVLEVIQGDANQLRGEMVVLVAGYTEPESEGLPESAIHVLSVLLEELTVKQASSLAAKITGQQKKQLYQWALENKK